MITNKTRFSLVVGVLAFHRRTRLEVHNLAGNLGGTIITLFILKPIEKVCCAHITLHLYWHEEAKHETLTGLIQILTG